MLTTSKISAGKSSIRALRTIDRLLAEQWFSRGAQWKAVADFTIDGRRLGAEPYRLRTVSRHETRFEKKQTETLLVAHALAQLGFRNIALAARESPDFRAECRTADSHFTGPVGIEVAEVIAEDSARWHNAIENVRIGVHDAIDGDSTLRDSIGGRWIDISLWHCPTKSDAFRLRREILNLLRSDLVAVEQLGRRIVDPRFPALVAHGAHLYVRLVAGGYVDVSAGAHTFDSRSLTPIALNILSAKQKKAAGYDTRLPLWLVLSITDLRGSFEDSLDGLERVNIAIEPFERVVISNNGRAVIRDRSDGRRGGEKREHDIAFTA